MIQDLFALLRIYRPKLVLILLILAMPWAWAAFWVPWWVNLVCLLMVPVAAGILMFRVLPAPEEPRRESDDKTISDTQIRKMRKMSSGVHNLLSALVERLGPLAQPHRGSHAPRGRSDGVFRDRGRWRSASASSPSPARRASRWSSASGILEHTRTGGTKRESRPLPELVSAYEELAAKIAASLAKVADSVEQLEKRHETVRKDFGHVDTLLDQLSSHDSQIGVLALNTSVKGGTSAQDFVSVSDQIRTLSLESKALTRDIRRTLEQVRGQATTTHAAVRNAVAQAREASQFASVESNKLTREMLFNSQEVAETLSQIGAIGNDIQKDINEIIVALQFQDITHQKLQRLKDPMLSDLMVSLRAIFDETRSLSSKLEGSGMVDGGAAGAARGRGCSGAAHASGAAEPPQGRRSGRDFLRGRTQWHASWLSTIPPPCARW